MTPLFSIINIFGKIASKAYLGIGLSMVSGIGESRLGGGGGSIP